jgi:hypothetical protein bacD2_14720
MKMYIQLQIKSFVPVWVLSALLLVSGCSPVVDEDILPDGKYPMTFTTTVQGLTQTRATVDNTWAGTEEVAVMVGNKVKKYTAANNGALTPADASDKLYWTNKTMTVQAWYSATYSDTRPDNFTVQQNQNSGTGYQQSDMLYAIESVTYSSGSPASLAFKHLPAKVVVNLKADTQNGVTEAEVTNATVSLMNQALTSGAITVEESSQTYTVVQAAGSSEEITPPKLTQVAGGYQQTVQALVVPQQMKDAKFIKVTIGAGAAARDYYYTPTTDADGKLETGNQYTYNITVEKTGLSVSGVSGEWTDSDQGSGNATEATFNVKCLNTESKVSDLEVKDANGNVIPLSNGSYTIPTPTFTVSYKLSSGTPLNSRFLVNEGIASITSIGTADNTTIALTITPRSDLALSFKESTEVGDFYYDDGTWSNVVYTNKTCLGIVYWVGDIKADNYSLLDSKFSTGTHGLVAALWNLPDPDNDSQYAMTWTYGEYESVKDNLSKTGFNVPNSYNIQETNKLQGYINTLALQAYNTWWSSGNKLVKPVRSLAAFGSSHPAPSTSSGWYWPSVMELKYMCWGQGKTEGTSGRDLLNAQIAKIGGGTSFSSSSYWSSTEFFLYEGKKALPVDFGNGGSNSSDKTNWSYLVRPSLAF